jgi:hemolysin III
MSRTIVTLRALTPEERANALTHAFGVLLSVIGLFGLAAQLPLYPEPRQVVGAGIYGISLVSLYIASTLCHIATAAPSARVRRIALTLDYACIYLVIAGTYTPFLLTAVQGMTGTVLLAVVWALGLAGILWETLGRRRSERLACAFYLGLGWLVVVVARPLAAAVGPAVLALLVAGGLCYSVGVVFFLLRRLAYSHAVWHLFVIAGSVLHYLGVFRLAHLVAVS